RVVQSLQRSGEMEHLWRVAGQFASMGILNVADNDRLHAIISSLPLFPHMSVRVVPLARHQAAVDSAADV
ncbi:muconolactone Delta-isomerase family protein, partial [Sphingobium sp. AN641]|uniref:muconolactone Delta-isomerase n=1 Tax=Sphingobium sp. AN641 TaxID=3133443 RepID=UPI0030BBF731